MAQIRRHARQRILFLLKTQGPMSASTLASHLDISTVAVRQHLRRLHTDRLTDYRESWSGVGRPARIWALTSRGNGEFPDNHLDLSEALLRGVRKVFGASGLRKLITAYRRETTERYRSFIEPGSSTEDRLAVLADQRTADGFMAEWHREDGGSHIFIESHCSIAAAARTCNELCTAELFMFQNILGRKVKVERIDHLLSGSDRCCYRITPAADYRS
ncbi:MAG: transcriptional regulator [Rhodospirillaceae bacterium]|nr:transcriptional regulator [Rhodospirillaceae bacterium]